MMSGQRERAARRILRAAGLEVESVAPFRERFDNEFAAIVVLNAANRPGFEAHAEAEYDRAMEFLTDPRCPLVVTGEYAGQYDIRIYVAFPKAA